MSAKGSESDVTPTINPKSSKFPPRFDVLPGDYLLRHRAGARNGNLVLLPCLGRGTPSRCCDFMDDSYGTQDRPCHERKREQHLNNLHHLSSFQARLIGFR